MKKKLKRTFVIPAEFHVGGDEWAPFEAYPDAMVYGDTVLAKILDVHRTTLIEWRQKQIIPFRKALNCYEYRLLDVVQALREHGYPQNVPGNPIGTARNQ